jgi:hypothetical protein
MPRLSFVPSPSSARVTGIALAITAAASLASACSKTPADGAPPATGGTLSSDAASAANGEASAKAATSLHASSAAAAASPSEWRGTYESVPGTIHIPPQLKGVHWVVPETDAGLGAGAILLSVDHATGRIRGTVDGPLGPATLDGFADGATMTAKVSRKDPTDRGFTGTLEAQQDDAGGGVSGTLNVALAEVSAVRTAAFRLTSQAAAPGAGSLAR